MSQDLLAAFGEVPASSSQSAKPGAGAHPQPTSFSFFDDLNINTSTPLPPSEAHAPHGSSSPKSHTFNSFPRGEDSTANENNDDDWGDFEGSTEVTSSRSKNKTQPKPIAVGAPVPVATQFSRWLDEEEDGFKDYSQPQPTAGKTTKWDFTKPSPPATKWDFTKPSPSAGPEIKPQGRDPNVLFDADDEPPADEDDEDDFGDFEDAQPRTESSTEAAKSSVAEDLLGTDLMGVAPALSAPQAAANEHKRRPVNNSSLLDLEDLSLEDESTKAWGAGALHSQQPIHGFGSLGALSKPKQDDISSRGAKSASKAIEKKPTKPIHPAAKQRNVLRKAPPPQPVATEDDEQWDDFEAWTQGEEAPKKSTPKVASTASRAASDLPISIPQALMSSSATSTITSPPTNIPPPALVLSLFPSLFTSMESSFFGPIRQESPQVQQAIYAESAAITYLRGIVALATVCGRVIAGRKLRWKRDTILAQSMRIGPSAAGGVSGLKLTSIDKAEAAKEDREAADAVRAWQGQVGKLKSGVAEVKRIKGVEGGKIPELKETLAVKVAKEIEGGLKGYRACALCGLKREERVLRVDFEVEDSFGEWWVDDASMHRECRNFWEQHRDTLASR